MSDERTTSLVHTQEDLIILITMTLHTNMSNQFELVLVQIGVCNASKDRFH